LRVQALLGAENLDRVLVRADGPSEPRPKKTARTVPGGSMSSDGS
jgi:hypothetical protein